MMAWSPCRNFLIFAILIVSPGWTEITRELSEDVIDQCIQKCNSQNRTDESDSEYITKFSHGCRLWINALETSCETVCNATTDILPPKLYCVIGCNEAFNNYFQMLRVEIGTPPAPALVADSLTSTSLSLEWEGSRHSNLSYLVQWHYEELSGAWQYCRNQSWGKNATVRVENLQPYTKYRFRVAVLLSTHHTDPIVSAPSVVISTLPSGPPTSAPVELRVSAVDSHRISLSWERGPFPNGPILSYVLRISDITPEGYSALKDLPVTEKNLFYMFQSLSPSTTYTVSVAMRNSIGEGPKAIVNVTTPASPKTVTSQQPVLILGGRHTILQFVDGESVILYNTTFHIHGVGIDVEKDLLFISDSSGSVHKTSLSKGDSRVTTIKSSMTTYRPLELSVDWLNEHLYMLVEANHNIKRSEYNEGTNFMRWQITRCDYDGKSETVAYAGLHSKPVHIEVDPYNGYLFWVIKDITNGGLYRLDLADISNGVRHHVTPNQILKDPDLGAFTIDHTNFRIFVPHLKNNTILSVSLNGHDVVDFRTNTQRPMFLSVQSLSYANGLFYWINGREVYTEEYHEKIYYQNTIPYEIEKNFNSILVALPECQPIPIAVNPPIELQSVMGTNHAKITWQPPHLLGHQGIGAWQQWRYHLQITNLEANSTMQYEIDKMTYTAKDLKENTVYVMKAAAVTLSGTGPWSSEFVAKTLLPPENGIYSSLLWSANEGLLKSDLTGDNIKTLIHKSHLHNIHITDISWYMDQLYLVTNASTVMQYNTTSGEKSWMSDMENVGSLAVDWIGRKLYWSSPKQQLITRSNLKGTSREPVPIVTVGKELKIDSVEGFLYWNTGHAIECARLNGENRVTYYPAEIFRQQVMGLTIDLQGKVLYWIIHGYEESNLYRAPTADTIASSTQISGELISSLSKVAMLGPLCYFSDRLIWLQDDTHAVISDVSGHNKAKLNSVLISSVNTITVIDPNLQNNPNESKIINVIPESINQTSIKIIGNCDFFNITWDHITNINYGIVFYDIKIEYNNRLLLESTTNDSFISYSKKDIPPYSIIDMSIRPFTYWGAAPTVRASLRSPQAIPTKPRRPRIFILNHNDPILNNNETTAVFRWGKPQFANGEIKGYKVYCWYIENGIEYPVCMGVEVHPHQLQYIEKNVPKNVTYYFQVRAYTGAGNGPVTDIVSADSDVESPIPKLAISYHDSIKIVDLDLGDHHVSSSIGRPIDFTVNLREGLIYWINDAQEIFTSNIHETGHIRLFSINGTGISIAVDWISRMLYWSQLENISDQRICTIYQFDLNVYETEGIKKITKILARNNHIQRMQISPITRSLYWIETNHHDLGKLMTAYYNRSGIRLFFNDHHNFNNISRTTENNQCNCPENPSVGRSFTLDLTDQSDFKVYWTDAWLKHIIESDSKGCQCNIVVNSTQFNSHLPPNFMTLDSKYIYWSNSSQKRIYYVQKSEVENGDIQSHDIPVGHKILAIGNKIQPYPPKICLTPNQTSLQLKLINRSSESLTLELPEPMKNEGCEKYDLATPYYTIHYQPYIKSEKHPWNDTIYTTKTTFDRTFFLDRLRPFSQYIFTVEINNYYGKLMTMKPILGPDNIFKTSAEAPPPVQNLKVFVLSPNGAMVEWILSSLKSDDEYVDNDIWYEIHWKTEGIVNSDRVKAYKFFPKNNSSFPNTNQEFLMNLLPSQEYRIWIQTHSNNSDTYTDSKVVSIKTYPEPNNITLKSRKPYEIQITWTPYKHIPVTRYSIEYTEIVSDTWKEIEDEGLMKSNGCIEYVVKNLLPKTVYKFRVKIMFKNNSVPYYWPLDSKFPVETPGDRPSPPGKPIVQQLSGYVYQLQWDPSKPHGSPITLYRLYGRIYNPSDPKVRTHRNTGMITLNETTKLLKPNEEVLLRSIREANNSQFQSDIPYSSAEENVKSTIFDRENKQISDEWKMLYNGSVNYWIVPQNTLKETYIFMVQAKNYDGWSNFSEESEEVDFSKTAMSTIPTDTIAIILGVMISLIVSITLVVICICCLKKKDKKTSLGKPLPLNGTLRGPDVELATLRELPRSRGGGGMFQHSTNILYNNGLCNPPTDAEIALLPHIRRDQITLTKFLGSGAFGEVFEGKAKDLENDNNETRVAIKTLRKGATDQEKTEFLQEAQLMSNFKHEHILSMLGVCLDNDPHFIIMELMEGGDLLSYLRARRPMLYTNESLTLNDLLSMCMDVTKGCRYLEEMHFVHRDLACRNCLVSQQAHGRVVKIGDFGLARDIYKNDYYRKEGEGLLPVRWMAVECLTDGVFSRASDVWAWAVLCWEVTALGRQPYSALPNHSVMRYVRQGGTLQRPTNCPIPLFLLLQKCWSYNPDHRPTFKYCLEILEGLIAYTDEDVPLAATIDEEPQYITVVPDAKAVTNRTYFMDENQNDECPGHLNVEDMNQEIPIVPIQMQNNKYLELLYDSDTPFDPPFTCPDGYEIPRSSIRSNVSRKSLGNENVISEEDKLPNNNTFNSLPIDRTVKVRVLENNINFNRCAKPNVTFGPISVNDNEVNSLQKLIPNRNSFTSLARQNSVISHISDDEKLSQNSKGEANTLLNSNNFVKRNSRMNLPCNLEGTSRTSC